MRGIRDVTNDLRPSLLDDLGLLPALRSLVADFAERRGVNVDARRARRPPGAQRRSGGRALPRAAGGAVERRAPCRAARRRTWRSASTAGDVTLRVADRGPGFAGEQVRSRSLEAEGHLGLAGMRERITALGGEVAVRSSPGAGVVIVIRIPVRRAARHERTASRFACSWWTIMRWCARASATCSATAPSSRSSARRRAEPRPWRARPSSQPNVVVLDISMPGGSGLARGGRAARAASPAFAC